eukprot:TRINITY_DN4670_c0_g1_i1.p1 TRINITY_DN4670_c0_g1~~TRINITY_DN4670_c0_g1_i1.p1  ORF type:complete len:428 (-),score=5.73 TRINITY_DN4670_c0_g1_i1:215-1414(-)
MIALAILALIITQSLAKWEEPIEIIPSYGTTRSIFTDNSNGISHVFWCRNPDFQFHYRRFYPNGTLSEIMTFYWNAPCFLYYTVEGLHDGKTLYLVYQGRRQRHTISGKCQEDPRVCNDVYFSESTDGGNAWSKPVAVPRADMYDKQNREFPLLLVTPQKRLWVFYRMTGFYDAPYSYVTRPSGSSVFSPEIVTPVRVNHASVAYNVVKGSSVVSIFYNHHGDTKPYHYYTENNGVNWIGPEDISKYCQSDVIYEYPFTSSLTPLYLFVVCRNSNYHTYLRVSKNLGASWETLETPKDSPAERFTLSGNGNKDGFIAYGYHSVYYLNLHKKTFKKMQDPPAPSYTQCAALTSSYTPAKVWFWFDKPVANHAESLWVTQGSDFVQKKNLANTLKENQLID